LHIASSHAEPGWFGRWQPVLGLVLQRQTVAFNRYGHGVSRIDGKAKVCSLMDENFDIPQGARVTHGSLYRVAGFVPLSKVNVFVTRTDLGGKIRGNASFRARLFEDARVPG
jgi:hypothetical protein